MKSRAFFWKEQALYYSWGYTEVVQYGYRVFGGEMTQGGKVCWEHYVTHWNLWLLFTKLCDGYGENLQ